jgi:hypothetical protein
MRLNDEQAREARRRVEEARIRRIVREEIVAALGVLARAADGLDDYDTAELDSRALGNIEKAAENTVRRLTCEHEFKDYQPDRCWRCDEPAPEPVNPFEPEGKARVCPVDPEVCGFLLDQNTLRTHLYEVHTEDDKDYDRDEVVQRLLEQGGHHGTS